MTAGTMGRSPTTTATITSILSLSLNCGVDQPDDRLRLLLRRIQGQRLETHASTREELAEEFVVRQTHGLDAHDQSLVEHDDNRTDGDDDPVGHTKFGACHTREQE